MDYRYIEELLDSYWKAETTLEEENILRLFFSQPNLPAHLEPLRPLFADQQADEQLGDEFDERILALTVEAQPVVKARTVRLTQRLMPLFKAAAVVAIVLTLGNAAQAPWDASWNDPRLDYAQTPQPATDSVIAVSPVQAENIGDGRTDSLLYPSPMRAGD